VGGADKRLGPSAPAADSATNRRLLGSIASQPDDDDTRYRWLCPAGATGRPVRPSAVSAR